MIFPWKSTCVDKLKAESAFFFFLMKYFWFFFKLERTTDKQTLVIQTWVSGGYFLENGCSKPATLRKNYEMIMVSDNIWALRENSNLGNFDSFLTHKDFSYEIGGDIKKYNF